MTRGVYSFQSRSNIGIVPCRARFNFFRGNQRHRGVEIIGNFIVVIEVRKNQNHEIQPCIEQRKLCFLQLPPAVVHLQLRLDHIRMRDFAAFFKIVRKFHETIAFIGRFLRNCQFFLRGRNREIILNDCDDEPARRNLGPCFRHRRIRRRPASLSNSSKIQSFVHVALADVFVDRVVRDELDLIVDSVSFRVDRRVVVVDARQQSSNRLLFIFARAPRIAHRCLIDNAVRPSAIECICQRQAERR